MTRRTIWAAFSLALTILMPFAVAAQSPLAGSWLTEINGSLPQIEGFGPERVQITSAEFDPTTETLSLRGTVTDGALRGRIENEVRGIVRNALAKKLLPFEPRYIDTKGLLAPGESAGSPPILKALRDSLLNLPELKGMRIASFESADGTVKLRGWLKSNDQREVIEREGLKAIQREAKLGTVSGPFTRVDASAMFAFSPQGATPSKLLAAIEKLLPIDARNTLIIQRLYADQGIVELSGFVAHPDVLREVSNTLYESGSVKDVSFRPVLVLLDAEVQLEDPWLYNQAIDSLTRRDPGQLLVATEALIRGYSSNPAAWYLRAAGHLMLGSSEDAIGDVRVAKILETTAFDNTTRFDVLRRFQGASRIQLENYVRLGATVALASYAERVPTRNSSSQSIGMRNSDDRGSLNYLAPGTIRPCQQCR